ncbi:uncharacterized protein LOC120331376 isoform X2 [Styela clava]
MMMEKEITCPSLLFNDGSRLVELCVNKPVSSKCTLNCAEGYQLEGTRKTATCRKMIGNSASWSSIGNTKCVQITCKKYWFNNGKTMEYQCTKSNARGSVCTLQCASGYKFVGYTNQMTCEKTGSAYPARWTRLNYARCVHITCESFILPEPINKYSKKPTYLTRTCSRNVGTSCDLECSDRYEFQNGATFKTIECRQKGEGAIWSPDISTIGSCQLKILKNRNCKYWMSDNSVNGTEKAAAECKDRAGPGYELAMPKTNVQIQFLSRVMKSTKTFLINAWRNNRKWTWGDGDPYSSTSTTRNCAVLKYYQRREYSSCNHNYICEMWDGTGNNKSPCLSNPCISGGDCVVYGCSYKCNCPPDFFGRHCQKGLLTVAFSKDEYQTRQGGSITIDFEVETNIAGKADFQLFINGKLNKTFSVNGEDSTDGSTLKNRHTLKDITQDTYISGKGILYYGSTVVVQVDCTKITVTGETKQNAVNVSKDICNGNKLTVDWSNLENSESLKYTIKVNGESKSSEEQGPYDAIKLQKNTEYEIKVIPEIEGCFYKEKYFRKYVETTSQGPSGPPNSIMLSNTGKGCKIKWNHQYKRNIGGYAIRIDERAKNSLSFRTNDSSPCPEKHLNMTFEYEFSTNPNSQYEVQVGTIPPAVCHGKVPIAWSDVATGCPTKRTAPSVVITPAMDNSENPEHNTMAIKLSPVDERNGSVSCYIVVVHKRTKDGNETKIIEDVDILKQFNDTVGDGDSFVAFALNRFDETQRIVLGNGRTTCCDMGGSNETCESKGGNSRKKTSTSKNNVVEGNNRKLDSTSEYQHYILVSVPDEEGGDPIIATSGFSEPWSVTKELKCEAFSMPSREQGDVITYQCNTNARRIGTKCTASCTGNFYVGPVISSIYPSEYECIARGDGLTAIWSSTRQKVKCLSESPRKDDFLKLEVEMGKLKRVLQKMLKALLQCKACELEDDCDLSNPCFTGVECTDVDGGVKCGRCPEGYMGDGRTCKFIEDCSVGKAGNGIHCGTDSDLDGRPDEELPCEEHSCQKDNCVNVPNSGQEDSDEDGIGDACDEDIDDDGKPNAEDNCRYIANAGQEDGDGDGVGDACDNCISDENFQQFDVDKDGLGDECDDNKDGDNHDNSDDNCKNIPNDSQLDRDRDNVGDVCDNCPNHPNPDQEDSDLDLVGDVCDDDQDRDKDGVQDDKDNCPDVINSAQLDTDKDGKGDACDDDDDNDGKTDENDNCRLVPNPDQEDKNKNSKGDACEDDFDNDDVPDENDVCPHNANIQKTDFRKLQQINLDPNGLYPANWVVTHNGKEITETINSDPSLAVGDTAFNGVDFNGTLFVNDDYDDDFIGFIFGFQDSSRFYVAQWKQGDQDVAKAGLQIKVVETVTGPSKKLSDALWAGSSVEGQAKLIYIDPKNTGWSDKTSYRWELIHRPSVGYIKLRIYQGSSLLTDSGVVIDGTLKGGRLGVFCNSQQNIIWSDLMYRCNETLPFDYQSS